MINELKDRDPILTSKFPFAKFPFEEFNPMQSRVFEVYSLDDNCLIAAATSAGKAQPDDAIVLTENGYRKISDVNLGDFVIGSNGKNTKIIGIYPQGLQDVYRVTLSDKTSTECTGSHLWNVRNRSRRSRNKVWQTLSLDKMAANFKSDRWHIPTVEPVEFPERQFNIHPYVLGLLLGDGGIAYHPKITMSDKDIIDKFIKLLPDGMTLRRESKYDYIICGDGKFNRIAYELDVMCLLGKRSHEKFIPWTYLFSSAEQRWELVRGLMDSDGGITSNKSPTFEITSKQLADDMAFLIRSLGGWTNVREKKSSFYRYKGEIRQGKKVYRLTVGATGNPFGVGRKYLKYNRGDFKHLRKIRSIDLVGKKMCRCIKVDSEDGLYVTNDFIVTHNTVAAEMYLSHEIRKRGGKGMYLSPLRALSQEKIDDWTDRGHHFKDLNISICTGDHRLTAERKKELEESNLIIFTSEMLNSK